MRLFGSRGFTPYVRKKDVEGVQFDMLICDADARSWYDVDATDPSWPEMRFMRDRLIVPGDVVFECGGHHGCTAIVMSRWVGPAGRIVTFEPNPHNAAIIRRNLELNRISNVELHPRAVGARNGKIDISNVSNSAVTRRKLLGRSIRADMVRLDDFVAARPTLLKIDVEGFEVDVLRGASEVLKLRPKLAIEIHAEQLAGYGTSVGELMACLDLAAYECWIQWDDASEPVPYDANAAITSRVHFFAVPRRAAG